MSRLMIAFFALALGCSNRLAEPVVRVAATRGLVKRALSNAAG